MPQTERHEWHLRTNKLKKHMNTNVEILSNKSFRFEEGNYILVGNTVKIVQRVDGEIVYCKTYIQGLNQEIDAHYFSEIEPILITEKWLQDLGFVDFGKQGKGYIYNEIWFWFDERGMSIQSHCQKKGWKYIHELQNLVYWLSGEYLELK